jgi:O-antigen/teichoic acid export membrane protein
MIDRSDSERGAALQRKARFGTFVLILRLIALQLIVLGGDVLLRRRLDPADFGLFAIVQFALAFFAYFGDAGLGGALVQKKDEPTQPELSSIWCAQIVLSLGLVGLIWFLAPSIVAFWPDMKADGVWVLRALSVSLLLTSMRTVPMLLMERHLEYGRLSVLEVLLNAAFYVTAVVLARMDLGVMALVYAVLTQGTFGVVGAFWMRRWKPSLALDLKLLAPIVRFGAAYQVKNLIGFAAGAIAPVYGGRVLGQAGLGFINWAQATAFFPLKLVEVMARVSFPLFSRLQDDKPSFARSLERSLQISATGTLFFVGLGLGMGPSIVHIIYTDKWIPGLSLFYVYVACISVGFLSPLVAPAFDAIGRPQVMARFSVAWTAAAIVIVPFTTPRWGALGFVIGACIPMVLGNLVLLAFVLKTFPLVRIWPPIRASLVGAVAVGLLGKLVLSAWIVGVISFVASILALAALFLSILASLDRTLLHDALAIVRRTRA